MKCKKKKYSGAERSEFIIFDASKQTEGVNLHPEMTERVLIKDNPVSRNEPGVCVRLIRDLPTTVKSKKRKLKINIIDFPSKLKQELVIFLCNI